MSDQSRGADSAPRGCPCPYCTSIRAGNVPSVDEMWQRCGLDPPRGSAWLERVGAFGRSKATRAIFGEDER